MVLQSRRGKGKIICASILTGAFLLFCACLASAYTWNSSAGFFSHNCLYTFLNALKIADRTAVYGEAPRPGPHDRVISGSQLCVCASSNLKLYDGMSKIVLCAGIAGTIFIKPDTNGTDMVSHE